MYNGEWDKDQRNGFGTFKWENGDIFRGGFKKNLREGKGELSNSEGVKLVGCWVKDLLHGEVMRIKSGNLQNERLERWEFGNMREII